MVGMRIGDADRSQYVREYPSRTCREERAGTHSEVVTY